MTGFAAAAAVASMMLASGAAAQGAGRGKVIAKPHLPVVTGTLLNYKGEPSAGEKVEISGRCCVMTDAHGHFHLTSQPGEYQLMFRVSDENGSMPVVIPIVVTSAGLNLGIVSSPPVKHFVTADYFMAPAPAAMTPPKAAPPVTAAAPASNPVAAAAGTTPAPH